MSQLPPTKLEYLIKEMSLHLRSGMRQAMGEMDKEGDKYDRERSTSQDDTSGTETPRETERGSNSNSPNQEL